MNRNVEYRWMGSARLAVRVLRYPPCVMGLIILCLFWGPIAVIGCGPAYKYEGLYYITKDGSRVTEAPDWLFPVARGLASAGFYDLPLKILEDSTGPLSRSTRMALVQSQFEFSDGLARCFNGEKWCYVDKTGVIRIECDYALCGPFSEGLAGVLIRTSHDPGEPAVERWGYINKTGELVIPPTFEGAGPFQEGLASVYIDGKYGFIDTSGHIVIPAVFGDATGFSEGVAGVEMYEERGGSRYFVRIGYIDKTGGFVLDLPREFWTVGEFRGGLATVGVATPKGNRYGYINRKGEVVISPRFEQAEPFSEGLAQVMQKGKWGYIDTSGEYVIPPRFDDADTFRDGTALVATMSRQESVKLFKQLRQVSKEKNKEQESFLGTANGASGLGAG